MIEIQEGQTKQILQQRASLALEQLTKSGFSQLLYCNHPAPSITKLLCFTYMLLSNTAAPKNIQNLAQQANQELALFGNSILQNYRPYLKHNMNVTLHNLLHFKPEEVNENVWSSVEEIWGHLITPDTEGSLKGVSKELPVFFLWTLNNLKIRKLIKTENESEPKQSNE